MSQHEAVELSPTAPGARAPRQDRSVAKGSEASGAAAAALLQRLQRSAGNRAVAKLIEDTTVQRDGRARGEARSKVRSRASFPAVQRKIFASMDKMWTGLNAPFNRALVDADPSLRALYDDAAHQLRWCDFVRSDGSEPAITPRDPPLPTPFVVKWDFAANLRKKDPQWTDDYFVGAIIHELAHAASSQMYARRGANTGYLTWDSLNLPAAIGPVDKDTGLAPNQSESRNRQLETLDANWQDLLDEAKADEAAKLLVGPAYEHVERRINYAMGIAPSTHNETVLGDLMYWMRARDLNRLESYALAHRMLEEANERRRPAGLPLEVRRVTRRPR